MRKILLVLVLGLEAMAQTTQLDPTQLKRPMKAGTTLPTTCTAGDLFFKTDAPPGSNLYGCTAANTWSIQGGFPSQNCWFNPTTQVLDCVDTNGNIFTPVKAATAGTANQWVDYITTTGVAHTAQPYGGAGEQRGGPDGELFQSVMDHVAGVEQTERRTAEF
jgi:hypothetical protein